MATTIDPPQVLTDKDFVPDCHRIIADIIDTKDGRKDRAEVDYGTWEIDGKRIRMAELRKKLGLRWYHRKQIILTFIDDNTGNQAVYTNGTRPWEDRGGGTDKEFRFELCCQLNDLVYRKKGEN